MTNTPNKKLFEKSCQIRGGKKTEEFFSCPSIYLEVLVPGVKKSVEELPEEDATCETL